MQLQVGDIVEGKVTGITNFGAFVKLAGGETGMVHISEVSTSYIKDIKEHLSENQEVRVKILAFGEGGKISLSIKQALPPEERNRGHQHQGFRNIAERSADSGEQQSENQSLEQMMAKFKQASEEKMSALKRYTESKRGGGYSRRGR